MFLRVMNVVSTQNLGLRDFCGFFEEKVFKFVHAQFCFFSSFDVAFPLLKGIVQTPLSNSSKVKGSKNVIVF